MICLPRINDELWIISAGLTLRSRMDSSLSLIILMKAPSQDSSGNCTLSDLKSEIA